MIATIADWDLHTCLLYLNDQNITDEMIMDKMSIKKHTMNQWWKTNRTNPKPLAILRKWCEEFAPIEWSCPFDRPTVEMFVSALKVRRKQVRDMFPDEWESHWTTHTHLLSKEIKDMEYSWGSADSYLFTIDKHPKYYEWGLPITKKRYFSVGHVSDKTAQRWVSKFHPDERIRNHFTSVLLKET